MLKKLLFLNVFLTTCLTATEYPPWYDNDLEVASRSTILYQTFQKVETSCGKTNYSSNDVFLKQSLGLSFDKYAAEVELVAAATRKQHFNLDHLKLTGRYRIYDDIIDDPFSLVAGLSLVQAGRPALHDPASFHHGLFEVEAHLSVGKEISQNQFWLKRYFAVFGIGQGSHLPWLRADFVYAQNYCDLSEFRLFVNTLFGLGGRNLNLNHFHGYGSIQHRSIDLGLQYSYFLENVDGSLTAEYSYRVYAKNFPKNVNCLALTFYYPFGLGI